MRRARNTPAVWFALAAAWFVLGLTETSRPNGSQSLYMFSVAIAFFTMGAGMVARRPPRR